jgi:hypothetical protein
MLGGDGCERNTRNSKHRVSSNASLDAIGTMPSLLFRTEPKACLQAATSHRESAPLSGLYLSRVLIGRRASGALGQAR